MDRVSRLRIAAIAGGARVKVTHVITGLNTGGAETMLLRLIEAMRGEFEAEVISLTDAGPVGARIAELGVPVRALGMRRGVPSPLAVLRLARMLRESKPDVVQTWLYHADLIGGLAARLAGINRVIWGIHISFLDAKEKATTRWTVRASAWLSRFVPRRIVCCAESARQIHASIGYDPAKLTFIPNGFDTNAYRPNGDARLALRRELGVAPATQLIGCIARFHPQKDHATFIAAAKALHATMPDAHFVLCGDGLEATNEMLQSWIGDGAFAQRVHLLGRRSDVPSIAAALDVCTLSSAYGEAFPMVLGEAMACGVPCVATDVGDSALLIGNAGMVVAPRDARALATAWASLLRTSAEERAQLASSARQRIESHFSLAAIAGRYADEYRLVASTS